MPYHPDQNDWQLFYNILHWYIIFRYMYFFVKAMKNAVGINLLINLLTMYNS